MLVYLTIKRVIKMLSFTGKGRLIIQRHYQK
jgi:hypothetical protein